MSRTLSYTHTPQTHEFVPWTIPDTLDMHAKKTPEKPGYLFMDPVKPKVALTFGELKEKSDKLASALIELGLQHGDVVGIVGSTRPEWLVCEMAAMKIGLVEILMRTDTDGIEYVINHTNMKALFYDPGENDLFEGFLKEKFPDFFTDELKKPIASFKMPSLKHVISMSTEAHKDKLSLGGLMPPEPNREALAKRRRLVNFDSIACVYLSSGSTGYPKVIARTHFSIVNSLLTLPSEHSDFSTDKFFNDRPLAWIGGFSILPAITGMTMVLVDPSVSVKNKDSSYIIQVIQKEGCTCGQFSPYMLFDILDYLKKNPTIKLNLMWGGIGGERVPEDVYEAGLKLIPGLKKTYAMTECGGIVSVKQHDTIEDKKQFAGVPVPGVEVKIIDDEGQLLPVGEMGEICARTPFVFHSYIGEPERTREVRDQTGFVHTGDLGSMDERGYIKVFGRKAEVISKATMKVYPAVVERTIARHPKVDKVCVFGVPDKRLFEEITACVVAKEDQKLSEDELKRYCQENMKTPDGKGAFSYVPGYFFVFDKFPIVNSKIDRKELKKIILKRLNISE